MVQVQTKDFIIMLHKYVYVVRVLIITYAYDIYIYIQRLAFYHLLCDAVTIYIIN